MKWWLLGTAVVGGTGVWTTHFVAMLGYRTDLLLSYDTTRTLGSAFVAIVAVGGPLAVSARCSRTWTCATAGALSSLERLTEPLDLVEGDEAGLEEREGLVDVGAPLVADGQAAGAIEPGMAALDHPAMPSEPVASLDAAPGNPRPDPARPAFLPPHSRIIGLVGMQLVGSPARASPPPAAQGRDRVQRRGHQRAVVAVGAGQDEAERRTARVGDEVALGARLAAVRRVRAGGRPPFFAGTLALSRLARLQSISPAACRRSSST